MSEASQSWKPIETAPVGEHVMVRGLDGVERRSFYGKTSHVPLYGWLTFDQEDPEECDIIAPPPTEWRFMVEEQDI